MTDISPIKISLAVSFANVRSKNDSIAYCSKQRFGVGMTQAIGDVMGNLKVPPAGVVRQLVALLSLWVLSAITPAQAVIEIEVTKGGFNAIPIAITPFISDTGQAPADIAGVINADLARSGLFDPLGQSSMPERPVPGARPRYNLWQRAGVDYLVVGSTRVSGANFTVEFQLFDPVRQKLLTGFSYSVPQQSLRAVSHQIADVIFEEVTGIRGAFNTEIAYVTQSGTRSKPQYQLQLADADGKNPQSMLTSPRPILSPAWSPDATQLAYVSFEDRTSSAIYIQNRVTGKRRKVISRKGINGAPSWSPDGSRLAIVLSYQGNPDVYVIDIATTQARQITKNRAIDTEPDWLDNNTLVFTSDRSGGPQIYKVSASGGRAERMTFEGNYNASPSVAPDGSGIAMVHSEGGQFRIGLLELASGDFRVLSTGNLDESPSYAPNSQMILFATKRNGQQTLGAVSLDGEVEQSFVLGTSDVREPTWSPYPDR